MKCSKLDLVAKKLLQKEAKDADAGLARLQTLVLDTLAPLVDIVEEAQRGSLTVEKAAESAKAAITLLGNVSAHISSERRKKAVKCLSSKVRPLAEDEDIFVGAAPLLLGTLFETKMKAHLESLKCLSLIPNREWEKFLQEPPPTVSGRRVIPRKRRRQTLPALSAGKIPAPAVDQGERERQEWKTENTVPLAKRLCIDLFTFQCREYWVFHSIPVVY